MDDNQISHRQGASPAVGDPAELSRDSEPEEPTLGGLGRV